MSPGRSYCLISPCRDEAKFLQRTIDSVAGQTELPTRWIIVDDGSTDATPELLSASAARYPWIQVVRRDDRGERKVGPGVVDAFYAGYAEVASLEWDFLCKLDMDLDLPPRYFETLMEKMASEARLGTTSGQPYYRDVHGQLVSEDISPEMSVGASKFYRRRCFEQIGGLVRGVMWDGIDCHRARMLGWTARNFDEPETRFLHLRPMGSSQQSLLAGRRRWGYGQYYMGTGLSFMTASALYRMTRPPRVIGGAAMWWGYVKSALTRTARLKGGDFRRFLRRYQWQMLMRGKSAATQRLEADQERVWDPSRISPWEDEPSGTPPS